MLMAVVGGKMSEGINFGDELGRAVVMVGMPYANPHSLTTRERMQFMDTLGQTVQRDSEERMSGQKYYEMVCMRAVNQSIGRAIRHRNDFAVILLLDERYRKQSIRKMLPGWMHDSVSAVDSFGEAMKSTADFFRSKCHR
jgi:chromosome transmission fidelity protein 1